MKGFNEACKECQGYFVKGFNRTSKEWKIIVETLSGQMGGMLADKDRITMLMLMDGRSCRPGEISAAIDMQPGTVTKYLTRYYLPRGLINKTRNNRYSIYPEGFYKWIQHVIDGTQQAPLVPMIVIPPTTVKGDNTLTTNGALAQLIIELNTNPEFLKTKLRDLLPEYYDEFDNTTVGDRFYQLYNARRKEMSTIIMLYMIGANRRDMIEYWAENLLSVEDLNPGWTDGLTNSLGVTA